MTSPTTGLLVLVFLSVFCHGSKMFVLKLSPKGAYLPSDLVQLLPECQYLGAIPGLDQVHEYNCTSLWSGHGSPRELVNISRAFSSSADILSLYQQVPLKRTVRYKPPSDPKWPRQWTLKNSGQLGEEFRLRDINVEPAWLQGLTGEGVVIAVVDDGIMHSHEDLRDNFVPEYSYDVADNDSDVHPSRQFPSGRFHRHGTSCAGVISMTRNNSVCGVGVAYNAKLAGIRLLSGASLFDSTEARALGHATDKVDIYSNSWGPSDEGMVVEGPGPLAASILQHGVTHGRGGRGSVYVWASGNGGTRGDSCSTDGYASSIYTITIGSLDHTGKQPYYEENCPAKIAVAYHHYRGLISNQAHRQTVTTGTNSQQHCREDFVGTSVACPLVAGSIALAIQANPLLSWRDVQYLMVYTSRAESVGGAGEWRRNGAGLLVSDKYGFGAVNAEALVSRARHWRSVPAQHSCSQQQPLVQFQPSRVGAGETVTLYIPMLACQVQFLEHVVLQVSLELHGSQHSYSQHLYDFYQQLGDQQAAKTLLDHTDTRRGDISLTLTSPSGTTSVLLVRRPRDFVNSVGFDAWPFMTVLNWGESPQGLWQVNITYSPAARASQLGSVSISQLHLTLYGTASKPRAVTDIPQTCHHSCANKCGGQGPQRCDSCKSVRHAHNLHCTDTCSTQEQYERYCLNSNTSVTPTAPSTPGSLSTPIFIPSSHSATPISAPSSHSTTPISAPSSHSSTPISASSIHSTTPIPTPSSHSTTPISAPSSHSSTPISASSIHSTTPIPTPSSHSTTPIPTPSSHSITPISTPGSHSTMPTLLTRGVFVIAVLFSLVKL